MFAQGGLILGNLFTEEGLVSTAQSFACSLSVRTLARSVQSNPVQSLLYPARLSVPVFLVLLPPA